MKQTTKILITTGLYPPDIGGPSTYVKILADLLPNSGISVRVLPFSVVRTFPRIISHFLYSILVFIYGIGVDIIYAQDPVSVGFPSMVVSRITRKKFILKIVGDYAWEQGVQRYSVTDLLDDFVKKRDYLWQVKILKKIEKYVAKNAYKIITPSSYLKKIVSFWGIDTEKIYIVYNSCEDKEVSISKEISRKKLGLSGFIVISSGRLVPWKGFFLLIDVISSLKNDISNIKLFIIGDGPDRDILQKKINKYNLENTVLLTGTIKKEDLQEYLIASDIFLLNTSYEGFSHVILEAMNVGTPVITTKVGGNPEIIKEGVNGLFVKLDNKEEFKEKIMTLYKDDKLRNDIGLAGNIKSKEFTKERMINETIKILL